MCVGVVGAAGLLSLCRSDAARAYAGWLPTVLLLGWIAGWVGWAGALRSCAARLPERRMRLVVRLEEPSARAEGRLSIRPLAGCSGSVTARWPGGPPLSSGARVVVEARWVARPAALGRPDGVLVVQRIVGRLSGSASVGDRLRTRLVAAAGRLYGARAPVVEALVLGRRGWLDPELRQRFADAGLVHLLAISGFHVGLVAGWVVMLARVLRRRRETALVAGAAAALLYAAFLGWPAPATRAALLAAVLVASRIRQRNVLSGSLLAFICLLIMIGDPWALVGLGAWLSVASLWGAGQVAGWAEHRVSGHWLIRGLAGSIGATATTAPITAAVLGTVPLIGVVLNLVAIPLAALAIPGVVVSLVGGMTVRPIGEAFAPGAGLALAALDLVARWGAAVPGGHLTPMPGPRAAFPWLMLLAALFYGMRGRSTAAIAFRRWGAVAALVSWAWLIAGALRARAGVGPSGLTLHFLDVGQGDGAVIRTPGGHWILVDAGPRDAHQDAGRRVVLPFLQRNGVRSLTAVVLSHAHADHLGGLLTVLDRLPAGLITEPGDLVSDSLYDAFLAEVEAHGIPWHVGRPGDRFVVDSVTFTLLHPSPAWPGWGTDLNEDSLVLLVEYRQFQALFAGDIGFPAEQYLRGRVGRVDLLKVGHHGSAGSSGDDWLSELQPHAAVISVGTHNRYGHPAPSALARLARHHILVWRTDRDGEITATTDGHTVTIRADRGTERFSADPQPGEPARCCITTP